MRIILILSILAAGCGQSDLTKEGEVAYAVCEAMCDACGTVVSCTETCFDQWSLFGGGPKSECADRYLEGQACKVEHSCDDEGCGDPYLDMLRCAENID
jgi:hypothetical protein